MNRKLNRSLGLGALIAYGVGDILGAGIYALVGEIAGAAGAWGWLSFLIALAGAAFTALSYAELAGRFPRAAGEAHYTRQAFRVRWAPLLVGWLVFCSCVVSIAAVSHAFAGYVQPFSPLAGRAALITVFLGALAALTFSGIRYSSLANIVCTVVEACGLLTVVVLGLWFLGGSPAAPAASAPLEWSNVFAGAALAFYAFIGFEDLANIAEEARNPSRDLPIAILVSLIAAGLLYVLVIRVSTAVLPPEVLASSEAPLLAVVERACPSFPGGLFALVALFAVANTALLNFVTASRLLYGMARQGLLPRSLAAVHQGTRTPHWATLAVLLAGLALAFSGALAQLAGAAAVLLLLVFSAVNLSLLRLRARRAPDATGFQAPLWAPVLGLLSAPVLITAAPAASVLTALSLLLAGVPLVALRKHWAGEKR